MPNVLNQLRTLALCGVAGIALSLSACGPKVAYINPNTVQVSPEFSASDLQKIATGLVDQMSADTQFQRDVGNARPFLLVDTVKNKTDEHIDTESITDSIRTNIFNKRMFRFIARDKVDNLKDELKFNADGYVDPASASRLGKMIGIDYLLYANLSNITSSVTGSKDIYYKFSLIMSKLDTGEVLWLGEQQVRKVYSK